MNFLKKFGIQLLKFTQIVTGVAVMVPQGPAGNVVAGVAGELAQLANAVVTVEAIGQTLTTPAPGADKARMAAPLVAQILLQSSFMVGKKIADEALFAKACAAIGGDIADLLNSLHDSGVQTENKA